MQAGPIRSATSADIPFLWAMLAEAANWNGTRAVSIEDLQRDDHDARYLEDWGRPGDHGFVAEDASGALLGAAWYRLLPSNRAGWGYIDDSTPEIGIGVLPEHRGRGIGTALLTELIAASGEYPALALSVEFENPAQHLYGRLGFERVGQNGGSWTMRRPATPAG